MRVRISGAWKEVPAAQARVGGIWRALTRAKAYIGGAWVTVATFVPALTVSAPNASGRVRMSGPTIVTATSTATPAGGLAPFTYAWSVVTGAFSISGGTTATATFYQTLDEGETSTGTAKVIVTDSAGATAEAIISATLDNLTSGGSL